MKKFIGRKEELQKLDSLYHTRGFQMAVAVVLAHLLKLNKIVVLASSNISIPPCIPFIIFGSLWCGGHILGVPTIADINTLSIDVAWQSFLQYLIGSIAFAIAMGLVAWIISYTFIRLFRK